MWSGAQVGRSRGAAGACLGRRPCGSFVEVKDAGKLCAVQLRKL